MPTQMPMESLPSPDNTLSIPIPPMLTPVVSLYEQVLITLAAEALTTAQQPATQTQPIVLIWPAPSSSISPLLLSMPLTICI